MGGAVGGVFIFPKALQKTVYSRVSNKTSPICDMDSANVQSTSEHTYILYTYTRRQKRTDPVYNGNCKLLGIGNSIKGYT